MCLFFSFFFFFFNDTATTEIYTPLYTLSLHDALPISGGGNVIVFRHVDRRRPFLWESEQQPGGRWHATGEGPAHYFAETPDAAWAEFLRHEGITDPADLAGISRSMWAIDLPAPPTMEPALSDVTMMGDF